MTTITATDVVGNTFEKTMSLQEYGDYTVIDLGSPVSYRLTQDFVDALQSTERLGIDAGGRNHKGHPVWVETRDVLEFLRRSQDCLGDLSL